MRHLGIVTFTPTLTLAELSVISRRHAGGLQLSLARKFVLRLSFALVPKLSILPLITWDDAVTQYTPRHQVVRSMAKERKETRTLSSQGSSVRLCGLAYQIERHNVRGHLFDRFAGLCHERWRRRRRGAR